MKRYLLGIDVGTTGTKSILFSEDGEIVSRAYKAYPSFEPAPDEREQNACDLWDAVCETSRNVCAGYGKSVVAISLSTQGGTLIPTDRDFNPVRRAILWSDMRCKSEKAEFAQAYGEDYTYNTTGWKLAPRFLPLEIAHLRKSEGLNAPFYLSVPSYISAKMTGIPAVDLSNAGIEQTANISLGTYDKTMLSFAKISEESLAKIVPSGKIIGKITEKAAEMLGVCTDTVLVSGAHDQYAALLGSGATKSGDAMLGTGTAWAVTALSDRLDFSQKTAQSVSAVSGTFGRLSSLANGGVCLEWLKKSLVPLSYSELDEQAELSSACEDGLFFFPEGKKTFYGINLSHGGGSFARAVMEGVCFAAKTKLLKIAPDAENIRFTGGASKSAFWAQLTADIFALPLTVPEMPDIACLGAALIAGVGSGVFSGFESGFNALNVPSHTVYPDEKRVQIYKKAFEKYTEISQNKE